MLIVDWHKELQDFKDAVGGLPNYKRTVAFHYVELKDMRIAELQKDINELSNDNVRLRKENNEQWHSLNPEGMGR